MAIETIDGNLEPAQPSSSKRGFARFAKLRIRTSDGNWREFAKVATGGDVTEQVQQGGEGRYYFTTADGALGLFAVRRPDGAAHYAHFSNIETMLLVVGLLSSIGSIARFGFGVQFPLLGALLGPLLLLAWFYLGGKKKAAHNAFLADNG